MYKGRETSVQCQFSWSLDEGNFMIPGREEVI